MKFDKILEDLYYNPETGYIGVDALYRKALEIEPKIKLNDVKKWFDNDESRQLNKVNNSKSKFMPIFSAQGNSFQIDLTFLPKFSKQNRGYDVMMTCININTRKGYAYKAKNKNQDTIVRLLEQFFKDADGEVSTITSDNGSEFINKKVQSWFESKNIEHITADAGDKFKLGKIERFNRTVKQRIENHFLATGNVEWYNILDKVIDNYNNTYHRSIKMKPNEVGIQEEKEIVDDALEKVGDILSNRQVLTSPVRIRLKKEIFDKGSRLWSEELYDIVDTTLMGRYRLREVGSSHPLRKTFRYEELQPVKGPVRGEQELDEVQVKNEVKEEEKVMKDVPKTKKIKEAVRDHKIQKILVASDINQDNIVIGPRIRKKVQKLDL